MPKQTYTLNDFSGGLNTVKDPRDIAPNELASAQNIMVDEQGAIRTVGGWVDFAVVQDQAATLVGGYGLAVLESDYETEPKTLTGDSDIDFDNSNPTFSFIDSDDGAVNIEDTFKAGDEILVTGTSNNNGYLTVGVSDSTNHWITVPKGSIATEANTSAVLTSLPKEDVFIILSDADNNKVDTYSKNNDTWTPNQITQYSYAGNTAASSKTVSYAMDGAIRVSDADFDNNAVVKWFGQIKRTHFGGTTAEDFYFNFFEKDNKLSPPTVGLIHASSYPTANSGFHITVTHTANSNSVWENTAYQVAFSFIYDGNQESLLYVPTSNNTFTPDVGDSVTIVVRAQTDATGYNPRISGGRVYARLDDSDESWFLLCDIDMRKGARSVLDGDYAAWASVSSTTTSTASIESIIPNLDTYESLNGYSSDVQSNSIGQDGEQWKWGLVANRRAFIFNIRRYDVSINENVRYSDRIYYSEAGKFDTFPDLNFIDVVRGDSESYVAGAEHADRLLAFKENSVQIINVSSSVDTGWFLEDNLKYHGIRHPAALAKTEYGIAWINDNGCYLYDGRRVRNLIDNKIDDDEWADFIGITAAHVSIIGYERHKKQLIIMKDCTGNLGTSGDAYLYDFKTKSWVKLIDAFTDSVVYSNFVHNWDGDLVISKENSSNVEFYQWDSDSTTGVVAINFITKDIDFGDPNKTKKIYNVYVTYKANKVLQDTGTDDVPLLYAKDGSTTFTNFDTCTVGGSSSTTQLAASATNWDVATFGLSTIQSVQSLKIKLDVATGTSLININDISIEYRPISKRFS